MRRTKNLQAQRENDDTRKQAKSSRAFLKDYSGKHRVEMFWDLNKEAELDQIFKLKVDDLEVYLDAEDVARAVRWV